MTKFDLTANYVTDLLGLTRGRLSQLCNGRERKYSHEQPILTEGVDFVRIILNGRAKVMFSVAAIKKIRDR